MQPKTGLGAGTHNETITFASDHATSDSVDVTFTVDAATYTVDADKALLAYGSAIEGYATAPAAQQVTITNNGNLSVTFTLPTSTDYDISTSDSLTLAPAGTATFSVQPKTGLGAGTHNETITFASDHSTSDSVDVTFTVDAATYTADADKTSLAFGSEIVGYASAPAAQTVTITNNGNSSFTLTLPTSTKYSISTSDSLTLAPAATATFDIQPKTGLTAGTHNETITFASDHSTSDSVDVTFTVNAATYTVEADKASLAFGSEIVGYSSAPAVQTVTTTNNGNSSLTLTLPTSTDYDISTTDSLTLAPAGTSTFSVQPKTGLGAGTHNETITFASDHATSDSVDVSFTVNDASYAISADKNTLAFGSAIEGYATAPAAQQVTITNNGNLSVTLTLPTSTDYDIATSDSLTLAPAGTATFSVQPKTGLSAGTHNETITFASDHSTSDSVDVSFAVDAATYTVSADKNTLAFGSAIEGYATAPAAQQVTITNNGNSSLTLTLPTSTDYDIATSDSLTLAPAGTATFSVQPKTGLSAGTHNETITFASDHATSDSVDVSFAVDAATYTVSADKNTLAFGSAIEGYATAPRSATGDHHQRRQSECNAYAADQHGLYYCNIRFSDACTRRHGNIQRAAQDRAGSGYS